MPKIKTHSGAKKRFKLTKNGRVKCSHQNHQHNTGKKTRKSKRDLRKITYANKSVEATMKKLVPYK